MSRYFVRRFLWSLLVLWGVTLLVFFAIHLPGGGDPSMLYLPLDATREQLDAFRHRMGFDQPVHVQYLLWLGRAIHGDFGNSLRYAKPVFPLILERMPATLELAVTAQMFALVLALPLGILAAVRRKSVYDGLTMLGALFGQSMPGFWLGLMLMLVFGVVFRILPISGRGGPKHLILPAVTLGTFFLARDTRLMRSGMLEVLGQDYITTARSKGLGERAIIWRHALKNALIPLTTMVGMDFGALLAGTVVIEHVFAWPGVGRLIFMAINQRDFPLIQAAVFLIAIIFVAISLLVDLSYTYLDPRIRLAES
jgi:ABC-type dipeptide/oligopeptide/nickel transport system permease component